MVFTYNSVDVHCNNIETGKLIFKAKNIAKKENIISKVLYNHAYEYLFIALSYG